MNAACVQQFLFDSFCTLT